MGMKAEEMRNEVAGGKMGWVGGVGRRQNTGDRRQNAEDELPRDGNGSKGRIRNCGVPTVVRMGVLLFFCAMFGLLFFY
jgi:hypothetical protein